MTGGFSEVVGRGSFGCVYRGMCGHTAVAVKVIDPVSDPSASMSVVTNCNSVIQKALQDISRSTFTTELNSLTR